MTPQRILVIEDHVLLLDLIARSLEQAGYVVMTADSTKGALAAMTVMLPELIVSDIMMPGLDGYAMVAAVRANPRTDLIPIVFLTAKDSLKERIRGLHAGIDAYLTKPFEPEELVAVVDNILGRINRTLRRVARLPRADHTVGPAASSAEPSLQASPLAAHRAASDSASHPPTLRCPALTRAEQRIAAMVAQGLPNKDIASRLGVSPRTVETHLSNILAKKSLSNRVELALLITRETVELQHEG